MANNILFQTVPLVHGRVSASSHNEPHGDIIHCLWSSCQTSSHCPKNVFPVLRSYWWFSWLLFASILVSHKTPTHVLSVYSSFVVRSYWQSHNVAWRNEEALAPSSIFQRSIKVLNLSAGPLPPLAIIDPSGLRWVCEYGTRLFIYSLTLLRVLELLVPAVYNSQAGLLTLLKKERKKKNSRGVAGYVRYTRTASCHWG